MSDLVGNPEDRFSHNEAHINCCFQISDYSERRRGRKPKVDPAFLDVDKLTGEENVSVINRLTGKKVRDFRVCITLYRKVLCLNDLIFDKFRYCLI